MARSTFAIIVLILLPAAGCGSSAAPESTEEIVLKLVEQAGSGESGAATLIPLGKRTKVVLELQDRSASPVSQPKPAHIHRGSCAKLDPAPAYGLGNVQDGRSTSTVSVKLSNLQSGSFAIDVHESAAQIESYVACGDLEDARPRTVDPLGHDRIDD